LSLSPEEGLLQSDVAAICDYCMLTS